MLALAFESSKTPVELGALAVETFDSLLRPMRVAMWVHGDHTLKFRTSADRTRGGYVRLPTEFSHSLWGADSGCRKQACDAELRL
jgi:hypothetical protein